MKVIEHIEKAKDTLFSFEIIPPKRGTNVQEIINIVKDLEPKRDYLYIKDMVSLIDLIINSKSAYGVYNVGSGESYSVGQVIDLVVDILNKPINVKASGVRRESEVMDCYADIRKLVKDFDWIKKYSLRSGLADYIDEIK